MNTKRIYILALGFLLVFAIAACSRDAKDSIGLRGEITQIILNEDNKVTAIMAEGQVESDTTYDKARVGIAKDTVVILKATGQKLSPEDLKEGMRVEVVFRGAVAESYPVQGQAKTIRVLE